MSGEIERRWVSLVDSPAWRRVMGGQTMRGLRRSDLFQAAQRRRQKITSGARHLGDPHRFDSVEVVLVFVGHVKSGGTMLGAMLDAHPHAAISDEVDVVDLTSRGFRRDQVFHMIEKGARREAMKGRVTARRLDPYSFAVPGHQGRLVSPAQVMGDTRAGPTTRRIGEDLGHLDRLAAVFAPAEVKFVHVVRAPFDPIAAMVRRSGRSFEAATADYAAQCHRLERIRSALGPDDLLTVRYEDFVGAPAAGIDRVCRHLGLDASAAYLRATSAVIDADRPGERHGVDWPTGAVDAVRTVVAAHDFLAGYEW